MADLNVFHRDAQGGCDFGSDTSAVLGCDIRMERHIDGGFLALVS